jgi:hypothetical protein
MEEIRPHHQLGEQRLDTAMLRGIADIILDPKAEPSWKPVVLQSGKKDKSEEE